MPESVVHDEAVDLLRALLAYWARGRESVRVARNLAIRWDEDEPRIGVDPDICVLSPSPPDTELRSVKTWVEGHEPPILAIEVVSETNPRKDYVVAPDKYAASGVSELWIFDPLLSGPSSQGGPFRIQVWRRDSDDPTKLIRDYAGDGPAYSPLLSAHLVAIDEGRKLRLADDPRGEQRWPTEAEAERAAKEIERQAKEAERLAKEEALARVAVLEAALKLRV